MFGEAKPCKLARLVNGRQRNGVCKLSMAQMCGPQIRTALGAVASTLIGARKAGLGPPVVPFSPLFWGSPTKIDYRKKGYPYSNLFLVEDLVVLRPYAFPFQAPTVCVVLF